MAKTKINYLEMARQKAKEKAATATKPKNEKEFTPKEAGKYRIRLLPPIGMEDGVLPYHSHSFHFLPNIGENKKGEYVYSKKQYGADRDPIDKVVSEMYDSGEENLKSDAGKIKRKRNFYWNCLVYDAEGNASFKVLRDTTNEGKLTRVLCEKMGITFFRDVEDNWVGEEAEGADDEDRDLVDLLDIEDGHDFYVVKKVTGKNNWDFNFESSYAAKSPRPLSDEEKEMLNERVDLTSYVTYIEDIKVVENKLQQYLNGGDAVDTVTDEDDVVPVKKTVTKPAPKPASKKKPVVEEEIDLQDLTDQLDED